jgi:signal peptidase I
MDVNYIWIVFTLLLFIALYGLFTKAGEKGWKGLVPIYNIYVWLKIIDRPWWWLLLTLIPGVGFLMLIIMSVQTVKAFGRYKFTNLLMAALFPISVLYLVYLGFNRQDKFIGPEDKSKLPRSATREWVDAIVFAVVAATVIRTFFIEAFTIPTSSMEKTLMVGDYLFVSKVSYGPKLPNTPLSFPFAHHTLPFTHHTKSYVEWMKLPYLRLPGFGSVQNNDIVVFNFPEGDTVVANHQGQSYYSMCRQLGREKVHDPEYPVPTDEGPIPMGEILVRPVDKKENYIKRCVGIPGDKIEIVKGELILNGKPSYHAPTMQTNYLVGARGFNSNAFRDLDVNEKEIHVLDTTYYMPLINKHVETVKRFSFVTSITPAIDPPDTLGRDYTFSIFPNDKRYTWSKDNFGPLTIPKQELPCSSRLKTSRCTGAS